VLGSHMSTADSTGRRGGLVGSVDLGHVLLAATVLVLLYVYLPILSLIAFSFNSGGLSFPFGQLTLGWYAKLLADSGVINAIVDSLKLAVVVTLVGTTLSTSVALAYMYGFRARRALLYLLITGIVIPGVTYGIGANILLVDVLGFSKQLWLAIPVHVVWTVPFGAIFLLVGVPSNLLEQEEAARVMGVGRWTAFREVILPQMWMVVVGAAILIFTLSYNEGTRSLLLIGQDTTMAIHVNSVSAGATLTPLVFALGSVTTLLSTVLLLVAGALLFYRTRSQ